MLEVKGLVVWWERDHFPSPGVPIEYLLNRGQSIKVFSMLLRKACDPLARTMEGILEGARGLSRSVLEGP